MGKYKVYVYAICKNERKFAARWMQSMGEADGVYVLDTGSEDGSEELLSSLGAHVQRRIVTPWRFDTARNLSLDMVPEDADICVCTDLDEVASPGWRQALEAAWHPGVQQALYKYVWSFRADGSEDVVFDAEKIHARRGFRWVNPVHEVLRSDAPPSAVYVAGMQVDHHPDALKSRAQYLPLLEQAVAEDPSNDRNVHYLGREYLFRGQYQKCIDMLNRHLSLPSATWREERCASLRYMAQAYGALGDAAAQESCLLRAAAEAPRVREPWIDLARFYYAAAQWEGLLYACRKALAIASQSRNYICESACYGPLPYDLLSIACWRLGLRTEARAAVEQALRLAPGDERLRRNRELMEERESL
ncbi:MAG: glycosyl transferase family 2 [Clostridia bacterium]|nr:glycosyl transferase family 2 [Clostridia bacterium]